MDYKQKYEQALEYMRTVYPTLTGAAKEDVEHYFPELKESDDEKIRKTLKSFFDSEISDYGNVEWRNGIRYGEIVSWLEKQGEKKQGKTPIWNHWKDGIAGNGEGKLIYLIKKGNSYSLSSCLGYECDYILLSDLDKLMLQEKQGEQKTAEKVEPKFKAGDFITDGKRIFQIKETVWERNNRNDGSTYCESLIVNLRDGNTYANNTDLKEYYIWTIQDAKDGDVLACPSGWTCIFKSLYGDTFSSYCFIDKTGWFCEKGSECHTLNKEFTKAYNGEIKPGTKEQRDKLEKAIMAAGYKWNRENLKLEKI